MTKKGFDKEKPPAPMLPTRTVTMPEIGEISRPPQPRPPVWVWVLVFVVAVIVLLVIMIRTGARSIGLGGLFIMPLMAFSLLMMMRNRGSGANEKTKPAALNQTRVDYLRNLDELRDEVAVGAKEQAAEISYHHPDPCNGSLLTVVGTGRMWERRPTDRNFGHVRIGRGMTGLNTIINPPQKVPPPEYRETSTAIAARDFLLEQNVVHDVGRPLHLFDQIGWAFFAEEAQRPLVQGTLRALVCQLCVFHAPDVVRLAVITDDPAAWDWAKWWPHIADPELVDACGPARMIYSDVGEFMERFGEQWRSRPLWSPPMEGQPRADDHWVIVVDMPGANCAPLLGSSGFAGVAVLEATNDYYSPLATSATAMKFDAVGNLLRAREVV
ncbi:cell division protein FtsK [Mycolicibacterium sp.]|uniref:cell division protein FtsK n=1 Tax=Mycolicibacterium sp. TaxID=2320850 RepID=UPI003560AA4A